MKKFDFIKPIMMIVIATFANLIPLKSQEIHVKPLLINYYTIYNDGNNLAAQGDFGVALVSLNKGATWTQWRPFDRGVVIKMKFLQDRVIAFNSSGQAAVSTDQGKTWMRTQVVDDGVIDITEAPHGYYLRGLRNLYSLAADFSVIRQTPFITKDYPKGKEKENGFFPYYKNTICFFKNKLLVLSDAATAIVFDSDLNKLSSFTVPTEFTLNDSSKFYKNYGISCDSNAFCYSTVGTGKRNGVYGYYIQKAYSTELIDCDSVKESGYREFTVANGDKEFSFGENSFFLNSTEYYSNKTPYKYYKDYTTIGSNLVVVGEKNTVRMLNMNDKSLRVVSDGSLLGASLKPIALNDSTFIINEDLNNYGHPGKGLFKTTNNGTTFQPTLLNEFTDENYSIFPYVHFDKTTDKINFISHTNNNDVASVFTTTSKGDKMSRNCLENISISDFLRTGINNAKLGPVMQKFGDNYVISLGADKTRKKYTKLALLDNSFNKIRETVAPEAAVDYYYAVDTLTYFIHCANMNDSTSEVRYTSDAGASWITIAEYDSVYEEIYVGDVTNRGRTYMMLAHRNALERREIINIIDLETREKQTFYEWVKKWDPNFKFSEIRFLSDENFVYVTRGDRIYVFPDLLDKSSMRSRAFPNNGRVIGHITKYGNRFIATYQDDFNDVNLCVLEPEIPLTANEEAQLERSNYLYCFPPFPIPAKNEVRSLIYWDLSLDIENDDISVYNLFSKVAGREDITIEKTSPYSGYLVWNCSGYEPGVYFIVINHGDAKQMIKIIINI